MSATHPSPRTPRRSHTCLAAALLLLLGEGGCERPAGPADEAVVDEAAAASEDAATAEAVEQVRRGYLGRDWWACARDGDSLLARHPGSPRLRAWTILCTARSGVDAVPLADTMLAEKPGEPWALFARAGALIDHPARGKEEAIAAARAALAALPGHADAVWQLGRALVVHGSRDETSAFFAEHGGATAELLALELAFALERGEATEAQVLELAAKARAADPRNVDADYVAAAWLLSRHRAGEAGPLLAHALELSPGSPAIHAQLWEALLQASDQAAGNKDDAGEAKAALVRERGDALPSWDELLQASLRGPEGRRAAIDVAVAALLRTRGDSPAGLKAAADVYGKLAPELRTQYEDQILQRFPTSREADWVRIGRIRPLMNARSERMNKKTPDPAADSLLRAQIEEQLREHPPAMPGLLGELHMDRHELVKDDPAATPEELLAAVQGWAEHERVNLHSVADAAVELAERTTFDAEAEAVVRLCLRRLEAQVPGLATRGANAEIERNGDLRGGLIYSALGAVLLATGRHEEAREALQRSYELLSDSPDVLVRLAKLAEAQGRIADAEQHLAEGLALWRGEEKCGAPLKAMYVRQHGSDRGYARYRAKLEAGVREHRRAKLLATAIAEPKPMPPFELPRLSGPPLRSESLLGRVVVINLWSVWCHPCVEEMPALQQLARAFAKDERVVVLTMNIDPHTDELAAWMAERKLDLEVLLGARWFADNGYNTLPTTLFLDREGRIAFSHEEATERLIEEFTWRIEALRDAKPRAG